MDTVKSVIRSNVAVAKVSTVIATVAVVVIAGVFMMSGPAIALSGFTAGDVSIETDDGELSAVTIAPSGGVTWSGLDAEATNVEIRIFVRNETDTVYAHNDFIAVSGTSGSVNFATEQINLLNESDTMTLTRSNYFATDQFSAADNETKQTQLEVQIVVYVHDSEGNFTKIDEFAGFVVTVSNNETVVSSSGTVNTGASD